MPKNSSIKHTLIIGSGPIVIGQACEFDYSGTQAARSLKEEGIIVTLINSNPATIMTDPVNAHNVYLLPLNSKSIIEILDKHPDIDSVLPTMGGQTALNLCKECDELGIWKERNINIIGVDIAAIDLTEDRDQFRSLMNRLNISVPKSKVAKSYLEGKSFAQEIGFPIVIRPSFTLGGAGGSFVKKKEDFEEALKRGLQTSPIHQVLIEQAVLGWKEFELELLRDKDDNIAIICTIENFDAMGVHTGDSITVAPAMTLSDVAYQNMRDMAMKMMRALGTFAGGCNVQFALNPANDELAAIEINPRVSRSSALASKATGYPIAKIASKLAIGYRLDELINPVTKSTSAFFEPSIDYVIVKIPRWNFDKFIGSDTQLGLQMKSVGEVMGIGRTFNEALQKACQSLELKRHGLGADGYGERRIEIITDSLQNPSWDRLFHIKDALALGLSVKTVHDLTKIDDWFLRQIQSLVKLEQEIRRYSIENIDKNILKEAKQNGYSDVQIAYLLNSSEDEVYNKRIEMGIKRTYKSVDTCAAEFESPTPYYYSTFEQENESIPSNKPKILILGAGPNRIGQGIEFDYCCVHGVMAAQKCGYDAIMMNCNPETVSTDFDISDKLYFEPVYWEHLKEIIELEKPEGVIVQLGGQTALKLSAKLQENNIPIIGSSFDAMDIAEDRGRFSDLLKSINIPYPEYGVAMSVDEAIDLAKQIGYPVLLRPSYVLGGQGMRIVINDEEIESWLIHLMKEIPNNRILIDKFLENADECEADCICDGEEVYIMGIMEHVEPAGIHSGDSHAVLPTYNFSENILNQIKEYSKKIALALNVKGLLNIQFAVKEEVVYVIEANPRASRSMPFICKAYGEPYVQYATMVMLGEKKLSDFKFNPVLEGFAIKEPVFSFDRFPRVNKELGPEMKSTGEAIRFVKKMNDSYFIELFKLRNMHLSK
jgi:carbamoyl-phosphate synthase large subunit